MVWCLNGDEVHTKSEMTLVENEHRPEARNAEQWETVHKVDGIGTLDGDIGANDKKDTQPHNLLLKGQRQIRHHAHQYTTVEEGRNRAFSFVRPIYHIRYRRKDQAPCH